MWRSLGAAICLTAALVVPAGTAPAVSAPEAVRAASSGPIGQRDAPGAATDASAGRPASRWRPRPARYPRTVLRKDLAVPMSDGVSLKADLTLPADAAGNVVQRRLPVIVSITSYKGGVANPNPGMSTGDPTYLVRRGYAQLTVDARGTGASPGVWCILCQREAWDAAEVVAWAHRQPWSNGRSGMTGPSYMGIQQLFAAAGRPPGLRAIMPQVPAADLYRDVVATGGAFDASFIPLFFGIVSATSLTPPQVSGTGIQGLVEDLLGIGTVVAPSLLSILAGGELAYDGRWYRERSPLQVVDRIQVPTFLISGDEDIFARGTPLLFENLQRRGVPTKMIVGPWNHGEAATNDGPAAAGYGTLAELQLRWFDRYVRGRRDRRLDKDIAPLTYFEHGSDRWVRTAGWMKGRTARTFQLSGTSVTGLSAGTLTPGPARPGRSTVLPLPVSGLCSRSTDQWTAGLLQQLLPDKCLADNATNDRTGLVFRTEPLVKALRFQGPMNLRLNVSTLGGDGLLSVAVEDEAPDGTVTRLAGGWQMISHRAVSRRKSRYLDGRLIQVHHPFTKVAQKMLPPGAVAPVDVEVFPVGARIRPGHRLRVAIQAMDVPHLVPTLPSLIGSLMPITVHTSGERPSYLTIPA